MHTCTHSQRAHPPRVGAGTHRALVHTNTQLRRLLATVWSALSKGHCARAGKILMWQRGVGNVAMDTYPYVEWGSTRPLSPC
eukprot:5423566-Pyramimonas_sp.AAC.1